MTVQLGSVRLQHDTELKGLDYESGANLLISITGKGGGDDRGQYVPSGPPQEAGCSYDADSEDAATAKRPRLVRTQSQVTTHVAETDRDMLDSLAQKSADGTAKAIRDSKREASLAQLFPLLSPASRIRERGRLKYTVLKSKSN